MRAVDGLVTPFENKHNFSIQYLKPRTWVVDNKMSRMYESIVWFYDNRDFTQIDKQTFQSIRLIYKKGVPYIIIMSNSASIYYCQHQCLFNPLAGT